MMTHEQFRYHMGTALLRVIPNIFFAAACVSLVVTLYLGTADNPAYDATLAIGGVWLLGWILLGADWLVRDTLSAFTSSEVDNVR